MAGCLSMTSGSMSDFRRNSDPQTDMTSVFMVLGSRAGVSMTQIRVNQLGGW